jgi:hypothetical protein
MLYKKSDQVISHAYTNRVWIIAASALSALALLVLSCYWPVLRIPV